MKVTECKTVRHDTPQHSPPLPVVDKLENEPKTNILLVDDRNANLDALEETLAELGENLVRAQSGKEALKKLLDIDFAVILLDVQMPEIDGYETAELIRKRKKTAKVPIIFVTAFDQDKLKILKGYETGAVDYIIKPYNSEILRSKVKVFVDLFRMREDIRLRQIKEQQLRETLEAQLDGWQQRSTNGADTKSTPLQERASEAFTAFEIDYAALLDEYLEALAFTKQPPRKKINNIADSMGRLGSGPRDIVQLHINCVGEKIKNVNPKRASAYSIEGRLLALELMGYLVDFYRVQVPKSASIIENKQ